VVADPVVEVILAAIDRGYDRKSWHGTSLKGSLRGVPAAEASWRPAPGRHNVWELAVHAAYWKYTVRRRITGERRGTFALEGSNWFERPEPGRATEAAWKEDREILDAEHRRLREAVARLTAGDLERRPPGGRTSLLDLLTGIAAHDLYHAGQIQLLKRLAVGAGLAHDREST
jgi:uncharacterized damage-inducible protein DinB